MCVCMLGGGGGLCVCVWGGLCVCKRGGGGRNGGGGVCVCMYVCAHARVCVTERQKGGERGDVMFVYVWRETEGVGGRASERERNSLTEC